MKWISALFIGALIGGCSTTEYRVEQIEDGDATTLPLRFDSLYGVRDGESVMAEARFSNNGDTLEIDLALRLGPPAVFTSGTYRANIGGRTRSGTVSCPSLTFLGGQGTPPSVGGIFELNGEQGRTVYRVRMPATPMARGLN